LAIHLRDAIQQMPKPLVLSFEDKPLDILEEERSRPYVAKYAQVLRESVRPRIV
jgi:hypothetical protein